MDIMTFSPQLQKKIHTCLTASSPIKLGCVSFSSPLLLAPMAGICTPPFRLLMEDLGAGGTVSELISCHGINYENKKTLDMLKIDPREKNVGIQLFGEDPQAIANAIKVAIKSGPKFIDINMGCPVKKVVTKGGGSALLKNINELPLFFKTVKKDLSIPLTIKIRTGWDDKDLNAAEVEKIAMNEGIEWLAIHGRTREQQYTGRADWDFIENLAENASIPIVGNGDLHQAHQVSARLKKTKCHALMIARGCLRNPFIFLESFRQDQKTHHSLFQGSDYWEVIERLYLYTCETYEGERARLIQLRKLVVWFAAGFPGASRFRHTLFNCQDLESSMRFTQVFFLSLKERSKMINYDDIFMSSGHG